MRDNFYYQGVSKPIYREIDVVSSPKASLKWIPLPKKKCISRSKMAEGRVASAREAMEGTL